MGRESRRRYDAVLDVESGLESDLRARRAQVTPQDAGLSSCGLRRTPGLRRE
ncbi:hypothetical protein [Nonomuraea sp. NPDC049158]|uniref:hypothetical protein n=1 Tax=Nonomuraea sp. NPDC049158 TaxID=3155649 RepID=UPI0033EEBA75